MVIKKNQTASNIEQQTSESVKVEQSPETITQVETSNTSQAISLIHSTGSC